jgi:hypothetical protein
MPAFIRTKSDEARWKKAKAAASKTLSEADGDRYWALTNSIYQKMHKAEIAQALLGKLEKASDEEENDGGYDDEGTDDEDEPLDIQDWDYGGEGSGEGEDEDLSSIGIHEIDPDQEGGDDADAWLAENDPARAGKPEAQEATEAPKASQPQEKVKRSGGYSDWTPRDYTPEEAAKIKQFTDQGYSPRESEYLARAHKGPQDFQSALTYPVRPSEMSPKMLARLKELSGHWLTAAERHSKLNADPEKNPMKHASGRLLAAHENATKDYNEAYNAFLNSDALKGKKGLDRHKAIQAWKADWKTKAGDHSKSAIEGVHGNKEHMATAVEEHGHVGQAGKNVDERMKHIMGGGIGGDPSEAMSAQVAAQHVGAAKGEEGYQSATVANPAASFAHANKDVIEKLRAMMKPEQQERFGRIESARKIQGVGKPKVIRRPGGSET